MKRKIILFFAIFLIFVLAFFLRAFFSFNIVFSEPIKYSVDDGVYHMRLVENELLGGHFPHRIYFDPYTYFPHGSYVWVAPLFDQLLAWIIWIISFGKPTLEIINKIAPFYPVFLGSLMVFVIYFTANALWNDRKVSLFSSFLVAVSGPLLFRSSLGTTDHHVAEVLFSSLTMLFLISAMKYRKNKDLSSAAAKLPFSISKIFKKELTEQKRFWFFIFLTSFSLGLYFLNWSGALLFLFIIFIFLFSYYLIQYFRKVSNNWILAAGFIIFLVPLIMIAPFFGHPDLLHSGMYNIKHLIFFVSGILIFIFLYLSSSFLKKKKLNYKISLIFFLFLALLISILNFVFPLFFREILQTFQAINGAIFSPAKSAKQIVGEMTPLGFKGSILYFSSTFFAFLFSLVILSAQFIKNKKPEYLLIIIWSLVVLLISGIFPFLGQQRFAVYLSYTICLLAGFFFVKSTEFGWQGLRIIKDISKKERIYPFVLAGSILAIFNSIFLLFYPFPFNAGNKFPKNLPDIFRLALENGTTFLREEDLYQSLVWLKNNTPDPAVDYYALYKEPGVDKRTGQIIPYSYPKEAYGVLARWDFGHMITYYAHRIPNANNSQQGVGEKKDDNVIEPGEAVFFTEENEEKAINYLDLMKTRYIITDFQSTDPNQLFSYRAQWLQGNLSGYLESEETKYTPSKYDNSMIVRLHVLDGRETTTTRKVDGEELHFYIKPLDHFRLVYESKSSTVPSLERSQDDIKMIKIFEYVKGAKIIVKTNSKEKASIFTEITTNQQRKFIYEKSVGSNNNRFEFIVPYSTLGQKGWLSGQTKSSVFAKPYKLKIGDKEIEINISESDILEGKAIEINSF